MLHSTLTDLPASPPGKTGWPWTEQSDPLPDTRPDGSPWPKISIVTPSYNQGQFIEETIRSVLLQGYPNLEYIVVDGGSDDETVSILEKYDPWIDYWVSEADEGQSDAINKGLKQCTGSIFNWINSDDFLTPDALRSIGTSIEETDGVVAGGWRTAPECCWLHHTSNFACDPLIIGHANASGCMFTQQAIWLRTDIVKACGCIDPSIHYAMDRDLYIRYTAHTSNFEYIKAPVAVFRAHEDSKTGQAQDHFLESQERILKKLLGLSSFQAKQDLIRKTLRELRWKLQVRRMRRTQAPKWRKASQISMEALRAPWIRLDRPTLGAIRQLLTD